MANNMIPRRSDLFDMTPFNFFEDFGRNFFEGFKGNMVKTDIHETETEYMLEQNYLVFQKKTSKSITKTVC